MSSVLKFDQVVEVEFGNPPRLDEVVLYVNSDCNDPLEDRGRTRLFYFDVESWREMDEPKEITITVVPGDTLNV